MDDANHSIDYLNDPLLTAPTERARAPRTPLVEQAAEVLSRINDFHEANGREPAANKDASVVERMLANDLAGLRASRQDLAGLRDVDVYGSVFGRERELAATDDPLLEDVTGIFDVREALQPRATPDFVADRKPCLDFDRFEPLFGAVRQGVEEGSRKPVPFHQERVDLGEFFALKGQLIHVADVRDVHERNGREDARLRVVFDNGTESNLLMSSLVRRLYEDKDARRISTTSLGPLFQGALTGFVYVLRSLSVKPELAKLLKVGTTAGKVEDRISKAETQAAFLFAPVAIVDTYELVGFSAKESERLLHRRLRDRHTPLKVIGPDGRSHHATEWFRVDPEEVADAVAACFARSVTG